MLRKQPVPKVTHAAHKPHTALGRQPPKSHTALGRPPPKTHARLCGQPPKQHTALSKLAYCHSVFLPHSLPNLETIWVLSSTCDNLDPTTGRLSPGEDPIFYPFPSGKCLIQLLAVSDCFYLLTLRSLPAQWTMALSCLKV